MALRGTTTRIPAGSSIPQAPSRANGTRRPRLRPGRPHPHQRQVSCAHESRRPTQVINLSYKSYIYVNSPGPQELHETVFNSRKGSVMKISMIVLAALAIGFGGAATAQNEGRSAQRQ